MLEGAPHKRLRSILFGPFTFLPSQAVLRLRSRPPSLQGGAPEKLLLQSVDKDFRGRKGCLPIAKLELVDFPRVSNSAKLQSLYI